MYRSILIPLSAGMILVSFAPQAMAQFNIGPGTFASPGPAATTTVKSSKSNTSDRMGGGGGKSPARSINLNSSRSNIY
jgi:hypothetical protein